MTRLLLAFVLLAWLPADAAAQPLAEVARAEAERRKAVAAATKVYTNDSLRPDPTTPRPAPAPDVPSDVPSSDEETSADPPASDQPARDQAYWSARIGAARAQLQRSRMFAEALQSRINALNADFVNLDDPAQRAMVADEREKALAELDRVNREIQQQTSAIAEIEEEARRESVPPGWLRGPS